jgi:hypothetical protein
MLGLPMSATLDAVSALGRSPSALPSADPYARWRSFAAGCGISDQLQAGVADWLARRALASTRSLRTR